MKGIIALLSLGLLTSTLFAGPASAPATAPSTLAATSAPSGTHYAMRLLRISHMHGGNPLYGSPDPQSFIARALQKRAVGFADLSVDVRQLDENEMDVQIGFSTLDPRAQEAMDQLLNDWQASLDEHYETWKARELLPVNDRRQSVLRINDLRREIERHREMAQSLTGRADVSPEGIKQAAAAMDAERQRLELDKVGKTARRKAIENAIADAAKRVDERVAEDPVAGELQKVVAIKEKALERFKEMHGAAQMSSAQFDGAVASVAEARARLLERKSDVAAGGGGETLEALNRELTTLSIDLTEIDAKLEFVEKQVQQFARAIQQVEPLPRMEAETESLQKLTATLKREADRAEQEVRESSPPTVTVIERKDLKEPPK